MITTKINVLAWLIEVKRSFWCLDFYKIMRYSVFGYFTIIFVFLPDISLILIIIRSFWDFSLCSPRLNFYRTTVEFSSGEPPRPSRHRSSTPSPPRGRP